MLGLECQCEKEIVGGGHGEPLKAVEQGHGKAGASS